MKHFQSGTIFTARNEVGQGYIFTGVCDSANGGGVLPPGGVCASSGVCVLPPVGWGGGGASSILVGPFFRSQLLLQS